MESYTIRTAAILGAGAVGASIGSMIQQKMVGAVSVLADGERANRYAADGILVNGELFRFPVRTAADATPVDLIIVATKSYDLDAALELAAPAFGARTIILSLLNGISSEGVIGTRFGARHVLPAMIVGIDSVREQGEIRYANRGTIHFGANPDALNVDQQPMLDAVSRFFDASGIPSVVADDIRRTLWWKFMVNAGINQASAILRAPYGAFQHPGDARELMTAAMREVVALSAQAGIGLREQDIAGWQKTLETLAPGGKTSMLQDVEAGRRTEVDLFAGTVIALSEQYGVDAPINRTFYRILRAIETTYLNS